MKPFNYVVAALAMSFLLMGAFGCKQGPAERAGKKIDDTIQKGGEQVEKVGKKIQDDKRVAIIVFCVLERPSSI